MHHAPSARRVAQGHTIPLVPSRRTWQARYATFARRNARAAACPGRFDLSREAELDILIDQQHAALEQLLATPAPTMADVCTKIEVLQGEAGDPDLLATALAVILADLRRLA
jgi:hypothetical protein